MTTPPIGGSPARVLVVEDEAPIRRVVVGYLQREGFEVSEAADGLTAVALAREVGPDVIVLDLGLPGHAGCDHSQHETVTIGHYLCMHVEAPDPRRRRSGAVFQWSG
jgi:CheY-like chemotaxis protein